MHENRLLKVFKNLNYLLGTLEQLCAQKLLEYVPSSEYNDIYIKFEFGENADVVFSIFNSNTKCIVEKVYTLTEILKKCSTIVAVTEFINVDTINLYKKSKKHIFNEKAVINM